MTAALSLKDVTLTHGDGEEIVLALDHVSLEVGPGELVAIVGPSGAGKSSLLAVAGALTPPTSGTVRLGELDLGTASRRELTRIRRERIGFVFQSGNLIPALTSLDQIRLPLTFGTFENPRDPRRLLAEVGMEHKADRRPHQLSGGERQRVAIARALMGDPSVVLADEPTAALDDARGREIMALLAELTTTRRTATVVVTHAAHQLIDPDHTLHLEGGTLRPTEPESARP